jgi:hypothetical protein
MSELEVLERRLAALPKEELERHDAHLLAATGDLRWVPNPGPQTDAYLSKADVILYGGEPGGGKTDLLLGVAFNEHKRALIMRRQYTHLNAIIDRMLAMNGGKQGFNGSPPPSLKHTTGTIQLGAAQNIGDEQNFQGQPRDFLGIDEATQFAEMQVRMLMGWVRSEDPAQRCRTVLGTNPPLTSEGYWVIRMFAPWLDDTYPHPAQPGELRYVVVEDDGDRWVDGPEPTLAMIDGVQKLVVPTSRTYIPSSVTDNPFYVRTGYQKQLDALPAQIRRVLMGGFKASLQDAENQIIPTAWIREAQARWKPRPPEGVPMCSVGVDVSGGGTDPMVMAPRHDGWFAPLVVVPAKEIPSGKEATTTFAKILTVRRDRALVVLDMGGGYGSGCYQLLKENEFAVYPYKGAEKTARRSRDKQLGFFNVRSAALWLFREALDPDQPGGSCIALPPDPEVVADLTAPTLDLEFQGGIKAESKEDVCARLGRSTNKGDAVIMSWFEGAKAATHLRIWEAGGEQVARRQREPAVVMGRQHGRR